MAPQISPSVKGPRSVEVARRRAAIGDSSAVGIPFDADHAIVRLGRRSVALTNLQKLFWPELGITKGDLLRYYAAIAPVLLPHLRDRAMVMKRYPNGVSGDFFFMKRAPVPRPEWIGTCSIEPKSTIGSEFQLLYGRDSLCVLVL